MKSKPKISVIVTHHLNMNDKYLDTCLRGLNYSRGVDFEWLVVSSAEKKPWIPGICEYDAGPIYWDISLNTATKKINFATEKLVDKASTHLMFLSDDVILSQHCLARMYQAFKNRHLIMSPMSNSDLFGRYETDLILGKGSNKMPLRPDMSLDDFNEDQIYQLIYYRSGKKILFKADWVCFFAVMMTKEVWMINQGYDVDLEYRHNDQDFCLRASKFGIPSYINLGAFAFHFGSRTMNEVSDSEKNKCTQHFINKWRVQ